MDLYSLISNSNSLKKLKIGLVAVNKDNEVFLIKEDLKRINKDIYNIPTIDVDNLEEKNIIKKFNKEYHLKIDKLFGYVNEVNVLDDKCDRVEQINLYTKINDNMYDYNQNILRNLNSIEENDLIPENVKNTLEIFKYNKDKIENID